MEYQQQIHIGPGLESICRIPQKTNADTADTEKASATQNKSKIGYTRYRESICKTKEKQVEMQIYMSPGLESICGSQRRQMQIHQMPGKHLQNSPEIKCRYIGTSESIPSPSIPSFIWRISKELVFNST